MKLITVDIEAFDPNLHTEGDGSCKNFIDGSCILCVGTFDGTVNKTYYPDTSEWVEFIHIMESAEINKIFHNGIYDLSWLCCAYNITARGLLHDTMTRMVYIDEYAELSLDACCKRFKVPSKNNEDTIEKWWEKYKDIALQCMKEQSIPCKRTDSLWAHAKWLWDNFKEFRDLMIMYNAQDCKATWYLYHAQESSLTKVYNAYMVDVKLTPLIIQMKKTGIRIDTDAMKKLTDVIQKDLYTVSEKMYTMYGISAEMVGSSKQLGEALNSMKIYSPIKTKTGADSWSADALARLTHYPVINMIQEVKGYKKLLDTYLYGGMASAILNDDRIHCTFSPNKREDGGTITGRFACSKPNLQQIPARDKAVGHSYGQQMRDLFLPEENCMLSALDYSQIEYLLLGHFAVGPQADWFRAQANAGIDFHNLAMTATGIPVRQVVKTFNYGVIYGMGWRTALAKNYVLFEKLAKEHNMAVEAYTQNIYNTYHANLPVIRDTMQAVQNITKLQGYIMTIGGRYQHKPKVQYDPATGKMNDFIYKMLNKLIQGSAADILKYALLEAYEAGIFDVLTMHLTVHDENVVSVPYNSIGTEANKELKCIMDRSFHDVLKVPMQANCELGPTWGYWNDDIWLDMQNGIFNKQKNCWWG